MIDYLPPYVAIKIDPIDPQVGYRHNYVLNENYAGLLKAVASDLLEDDGEEKTKEFANLHWEKQLAFREVTGPLEWVRFGNDGTFSRGVRAAQASEPRKELCGFTVALRRDIRENRMDEEPDETKAPLSPPKAKLLKWRDVQGDGWETLVPAKAGATAMIRHREAPANKSVKVKTKDKFGASEGFEFIFSLGGVALNHRNQPGIRLTFGDEWSIVFRSLGVKAYGCIEQREKGEWVIRRVFSDNTPLDDKFWNSWHTLRVYNCGGKTIVELDGKGYHITHFVKVGEELYPIRAAWKAATVQVSITGADCLFGLHPLSGFDKLGEPLIAGFARVISAIKRKDKSLVFIASKLTAALKKLPGSPLNNGVETATIGDLNDNLEMIGEYQKDGTLFYQATLQCAEFESPILCAFAAKFPPSGTVPVPAAVDVISAVSSWDVESGDPETMAGAQAKFTLSRSQLERISDDWQDVIQPFRAVEILARDQADTQWTTLFRGWITPNNFDKISFNEENISVVANDLFAMRLDETAGLIDERFGPLDLEFYNNGRSGLWGAECVKLIIETLLGKEFADRFNGDGNPLRFLPAGQPPIMGGNANLVLMLKVPQTAGFYLPPPFGQSAASWIKTFTDFDYCVAFYDSEMDAVIYGDPVELLNQRGQTVHEVVAGSPTESDTYADYPLITRLSNEGEFDRAFNDVRVWGAANESALLGPSLIMGRAGENDQDSLDPTSKVQSWQRTLLLKPDFLGKGTLVAKASDYANDLAYQTWLEFEGALPEKFSIEFEIGFLGPKWGEMISFVAPRETEMKERRITKVTHRGDMTGNGNRFATTIEARSLSASGQ